MSISRFRADAALAPLKTFQRRTVEYVFDRLYGQRDPVRQFLVADEVGLGKTMVARGVIAKTIEHLWDSTSRIDILYICSNQAIAAQNLNRLNVLGRKELALPTRMTLVPLQMRNQAGLDSNKVNFFSLTPGTTFDLRSSTGITEERAFLWHLLKDLVSHPRGLYNLLQATAGYERWSQWAENFQLDAIDPRLIERFRRDVSADSALFEELERVSELFPRRRDSYPREMTQPRNILVGRLRAKLSHACVDALEPDLIIMDEFQRFRDILHGDSDAGILARELFEYTSSSGEGARTLLLSATPYRMLTLADDAPEEGDHYQDFLETLKFLYGREQGSKVAAALAVELNNFRTYLHSLPSSRAAAVETRKAIENRLRHVIARTERVGSTAERDSMICEPDISVSVAPADLGQAYVVSNVARALDAPEIVEYWKSAPYLLNFMRQYKLKQLLEEQAGAPSASLLQAVRAARPAMLDRASIDGYQPIEPANARLRSVMDDIFQSGLEKHLWIPPALPYYGDNPTSSPRTKSLIFSSWSMVPDAIAAIMSFEAERRMGVGESGRRYFEQHRLRPLQFRQDQGRSASLRNLLLIYPSPKLAELGDPLSIFSNRVDRLTLEQMRSEILGILRSAFLTIETETTPGTGTEVAEWVLPAVIDRELGADVVDWLSSSVGLPALASEEGFREHVTELASAAKETRFAPISTELLDLLVDMALGSPAVCGLRALHRIAPELAWDDPQLLNGAARIAWAFRTLFNQHDAIALLRRDADDRYWRRVLTFSAEHNLQSVLDEYAHYLVDAEGLSAAVPQERALGVAQAIATALAIRPSQIDVDDPKAEDDRIRIEKFQMRGRFAMRLADYKDEEGAVARLSGVRDAFNSPFRPFVLATTSVGQEGLDFHPYCYRIYHWNLPSNPVDLEQREGRVHRFKGHAIRLNLAEHQGKIVQGRGAAPDDPWAFMFTQARSEASVDSDLIPYWIYEGGVRVERRVPMLPLSREVTRLGWLKRSLAVYRLAFGQPRQDELLGYLNKSADLGLADSDLADLQIRLEPSAVPPP